MLSTRQSWSKRPLDGSTKNAAALLWQVRKIAINEVHEEAPPKLSLLKLIPSPIHRDCVLSNSDSSEDSDSESDTTFNSCDTPIRGVRLAKRCRLVSMCSQDMEHAQPLSPILSMNSFKVPESPVRSTSTGSFPEKTSDAKKIASVFIPETFSHQAKEGNHFLPHSLVGKTAHGEVRGILRRKFSWRSFPELERYLIDHRQQYLEYSSQLNYTTEQKRYNNHLTQGLLDLAKREGYLFEDFSFAAVRDRIRCYYKSYVQAVKKKEKKTRKRK
jgi:hypothetical protein